MIGINYIIMHHDKACPWVEKYRPTHFDDIVLEPLNRDILSNIIKTNTFPNLLLYGPPGTGKTTAIINLINSYQKEYNQVNKGLMIHLNASDERGIDVIRNQITQFVNSCGLFDNGTKFVILDEVDYMTKTAQQALKHLLNSINKDVRFCLICNYITRIDETLQNEFVKLRFNKLPKKETIRFLKEICDSEKVHLSNEILNVIQEKYKSDIRSMINYIQSNQDIIENLHVLNDNIWEDITKYIKSKHKNDKLYEKFLTIQNKYSIETRTLIRSYFNFLIFKKPELINKTFLTFSESIMHNYNATSDYLLRYVVYRLKELL